MKVVDARGSGFAGSPLISASFQTFSDIHSLHFYLNYQMQQAELSHRLEEIRKRRKVSTVVKREVKQEVKQEDFGSMDFRLDTNGAIDLTLDD